MNWVRNNRFLAVFFGVIVVVGGALTFLLISAYGRYSEVAQQYDAQTQELSRLQNLDLYPNEANLKKYEEVRQTYQTSVLDLQKKLAALELPTENPPLTPLGFQDKLRKVVEETVSSAKVAGVGLPEGFYLGFEQYRGAPPDTAATPLLSTHLNAMANLVNILISQHVEKINTIKRGLLSQEAGAPTPAPGLAVNNKPGAPPAAPPLVSKYPVEIAFTAAPSSFRESLNKITSDKELYIVRGLLVKNQMEKGPSRVPEGAAGMPPGFNPNLAAGSGATPGAAPAAGAGGSGLDANGVPIPALPDKGPPPLRYVVGQEKLDVVARIDLASVKPPAAAAR